MCPILSTSAPPRVLNGWVGQIMFEPAMVFSVARPSQRLDFEFY